MNELIQNAMVDRARPWWNRMPIGLRAALRPGVAASPALTRRKAWDSGR
jgi:hypothetical protein